MKIVFNTGAGISVPSGIPCYRGPNGIYTKNPELEQSLKEITLTLIYDDIEYEVDSKTAYVDWWNKIPDYQMDYLMRICKGPSDG